MKKCLSILFICLLFLSHSTVNAAETVSLNDVQLRNDLILDLLFPLIYEELEKQYGEPKQYQNEKILKIKKRGNYDFDVTVQLTTFEGAHNPPNDLITITFSDHRSTSWRAIDFKRKRLEPSE